MGRCGADDKQAYRDADLRNWAASRPRVNDDYDNPSTGEDRILEDRALADWARSKPQGPNGYENDRR